MRTIFLSILLLSALSCSNGSEKVAYQCPMQCEGEKVYEQRGKCPVCEMDLEKIEHKH